jgi:hypothetical protein
VRVDQTRLASIIRKSKARDIPGLETVVPFAILYPDSIRFGWGGYDQDCIDLAFCLLHNVLGHSPDADLVEMFLSEVVASMPEDGWELHDYQVFGWVTGNRVTLPMWVRDLEALTGGIDNDL